MADYIRGEIGFETQDNAFAGFMKFTIWEVIAITTLFIFMAIFAI